METPATRPFAAPPVSGDAIKASRRLAPLEEGILDSHRPGARSTIRFGKALGRNPESGAWMLAEIEKNPLVARLGRMENFADPNRCILHSDDYSLQMTVRVPPGEGRLDFGTVWYPPGMPFFGIYLVSLVSMGKGGVRTLDSEREWPDGKLLRDFLVFKPSLPLHALESFDRFAIYATPFAAFGGAPGDGQSFNGVRP